MPETNSLTVADIVRVAVTAGIVTAFFNQAVEWFRDTRKVSRQLRRDATYLALRNAIVLEAFALQCAFDLSEIELHNSSGGQAGAQHRGLPELSSYPEDADWKALDPLLAARALAFPNELKLAEGQIRAIWDVTADEDLADEECVGSIARSGFRAWQLAGDLRRIYDLPNFDPNETSWDAIAVLKSKSHRTEQA